MEPPVTLACLEFKQDPWTKEYIALNVGRIIIDDRVVRLFVNHKGLGLLLPEALKNSEQVVWYEPLDLSGLGPFPEKKQAP